MTDIVFPQENNGGESRDRITEETLTTAYAALAGFQSVVADGLSLNVDFVTNEVDISPGTAIIITNGGGYVVSPDARTNRSLPATNGVNHVFLTTNLANDDDISIHIDANDTAPSTPSVKLGTVDTSANETTLVNRSSGGGGGGIDVSDSGTPVSSGVTDVDFTQNIEAFAAGDGVRVGAVDTRINVDNSGTRAATEPVTVNFGSGLSASGTDDGGVDVTATGGGGGSGGFTDSGSRVLLAAGTDSNDYAVPVYVPDSQTATLDFLALSLSDESTDTNVKIQLVDPSGTVVGSQALDTHPVRDTSPNISYANTSGSAQVATIRLVNGGSTDYAPQSTAADYVEFALKWSVA